MEGNFKKLPVIAAILLILIVLIKVATFYPAWVEQHYSTGLYPHVSAFFRGVYGKAGISLGDLLYLLAGIYLFISVVKFIKLVIKGGINRNNFKDVLLRIYIGCAIIYIFFNLSWGLNYNRLGIAYQLELAPKEHNIADLQSITSLLVERVNEDRLALGKDKVTYPPYANVFNNAKEAYGNARLVYPFITYTVPSIKRSLYGRMGNFLGFLGYYNPFTGEAQVNLTQPRFLIPFVTCHEMAHQLGYASESEANFVGYLAAISSKDTLFHYSAYFDLFNYANHELYLIDSTSAKQNYNHLDTLVKLDIAELKAYWKKSDNVIEPFIRIFYDQYLKANQQDKGIKSYNEVVGWLIAYHKKYSRL